MPGAFACSGPARSGRRGTLTYRSEDPSRLQVSSDGTRPKDAVTVSLAPQFSGIRLHGLAAGGSVRLIATSTEFVGDRVITVRLEPVVARMFVSPSVSVGRDATITFQLGTPSEPQAGMTLRAGATPLSFRLRSSDPQILELSRL